MIPQRIARELVYQLEHAGLDERLVHALASIPIFMPLYQGEYVYEVLRHWSRLGERHDLQEAYRIGLERWRSIATAEEVCMALGSVANLLENVGNWDGAADLFAHMIALSDDAHTRVFSADGHRGLGRIRSNQGRYDEAMEELTIACDLSEDLGDHRSLSQAIGSLGLVHLHYGDFDSALECFGRQETISREIEDLHGIEMAIGNLGVVYAHRGEFDRAMERYIQKEAMCHELGDRMGLSIVIGNMGVVYDSRGEYDRALACYSRQEAICREIGDRRVLSSAIDNMGCIYESVGEHDRALEHFGRGEAISREIGDRRGAAYSIGNMGGVYESLGNVERALECYQRARTEHFAIGHLWALAYWIAGTARLLLNLVEMPGDIPEFLPIYLSTTEADTPVHLGDWREIVLKRVRDEALDCVALSERLSKPDTLFIGRVLLARLDAAEGCKDNAMQRLDAMLHDADDAQCAELHYWMWRVRLTLTHEEGAGTRSDGEVQHVEELPSNAPLGHVGELEDEREEHRAEALLLYQALVARVPKHEYRKRIDELTVDEVAE